MSYLSQPLQAMTLSDLRAELVTRPAAKVKFQADDLLIDGAYHVTEIKSGTFVSLDCGGNPDTWEETVLQIEMPVQGAGANAMTAAKLAGIMDKTAAKVRIASNSRLTIEAGTAEQPMRVYDVGDIRDSEDGVTIGLYARSALCKPRHREIVQSAAAGCCAPAAQSNPTACCSTANPAKQGACCGAS